MRPGPLVPGAAVSSVPAGELEDQSGAVVGGAHLGAAVVNESLGQLPGAAAVKGGQPVPHPLVGCAAGHAVGDQKDTVSGLQLEAGHVGGDPLPGGEAGGEGRAGDAADGVALFHIGGGGAVLVHPGLASEQIHPQQVDGGEAAGGLVVAQGQGGVEGAQGVLRPDARPEKLLQQADGQGALLLGQGAGAHAVAQEHIEGAVVVLEPGPCVAGYGLAVLLFGGHPGHGHQRLALYQHQPVPAALLHGPEGEVHQLGKLGCPLLGAEGGQPRPLQLQAEVPGLVVIGGQAAINALGGQVLPQALFPHRVGHQLRPQLGSRRVQHPGQLGILAAHRRAVLTEAALELPPAQQGGQLLVGGGEKLRELHAAVGEVGGEVSALPPAPLQHGGEGVVEGVEGGDVVPLPAGGLQRAALADPPGRPIEDGCGVVVIGCGGVEGRPHGLVQALEGGCRGLHPGADIGAGPLLGVVPGLPGHQRPHLAQGALGEDQKDHRGDKDLVEQGEVKALRPGPQHRQGIGEHIGQGGGQTALPVEHPAHHPGEGEGHGVEGHTSRRQIHPKAAGHPHRGPHADAALVGGGHHRRRGGAAAHRQVAQQGDLGQGEQQGARQNEQAHRLPGGEALLLPLFRPGGEGDAVEVGRRPAQEQLGAEEDQALWRPAPVR